MHPVTAAAPLVTATAAAVAGAPAWVELSVPIITGLFVLAAYFVKDWLAGRRAASPTDSQRLVRALERECADLRRERDRISAQLDQALTELRGLRRREAE